MSQSQLFMPNPAFSDRCGAIAKGLQPGCLGEVAIQIKVLGVEEGKGSLSWSAAACLGDWDKAWSAAWALTGSGLPLFMM